MRKKKKEKKKQGKNTQNFNIAVTNDEIRTILKIRPFSLSDRNVYQNVNPVAMKPDIKPKTADVLVATNTAEIKSTIS